MNLTAPRNGSFVVRNEDSVLARTFKIIAYSLIFIISFVGNSLVIAVIYHTRRHKSNISRLIVNMCVSDILVTVWVLPLCISLIACNGRWVVGSFMCKIFPFFQDVSAGVSILCMTVIAFDRFYAIVMPFRAHVITTSRCFLLIFLTWFISGALHIPYLFIVGLTNGPDKITQCVMTWPDHLEKKGAENIYYFFNFSALYLIPLFCIAFFYTSVILELYRKSKTENSSHQKERRRENREVSLMLITVVILFAVSWAPMNVKAFLYRLKITENNDPPFSPAFDFISAFVARSNPAQNAIIYFTFNRNFKEGLLKLLGCRKSRHQHGIEMET